MPEPRTIHVISHTHWDREWYLPFENFRVRLVLMIDNLLDILAADPVYKHFYLDGQTILLHDYLEIRPEKKAELISLARQGRIQIGPWYTATDETLVSGESIIRNLLFGRGDCAEYGGATPVGYLPDQFGHIAQLPQILRGFDIDNVIIGRGLNRRQHRNEFKWHAPDGSKVFGVFMNQWYSNARNIPLRPEEAATFLAQVAAEAEQFSTTPHLLLMNGVDHMAAQPRLGKTLAAAAPHLDYALVHDSIGAVVQAIQSAASAPEVFTGELRADLGGRLDAGTLTARMPLKIANFLVTGKLERIAEPLAVWARLHTGLDLIALVEKAWRTLLQNHPHDSICGCALDEVASQMEARFQAAGNICEAVAERAVQVLAPCLGYKGAADEFLVYNPGVYEKNGIAELTVDMAMGEPTRSPIAMRRNVEHTSAELIVELSGPGGQTVTAQVNGVEETERLVLAPLHLPRTQPVQRLSISAPVCIHPLGISRYKIKVRAADRLATGGLATSARRLQNEHLILEVRPDNSLWLTDKRNQRAYGPLHILEDSGDCGDTYHYVPPVRNNVITSCAAQGVALVENGPYSSAIRLQYELLLPQGLDATRTCRSNDTSALRVTVTARLKKDCPYVGFHIALVNSACDHRLRVVFPTGMQSERIFCASQFCVVERPVHLPQEWVKAALGRPHSGWTDICDAGGGLALFTTGLPEVEPLPGSAGVSLALTLLRSVGAISRSTATPLVITAPGAQCLGAHTFSYAIYPHAGDWRQGQVWKNWEDFAGAPVVFSPRPPEEYGDDDGGSCDREYEATWSPVRVDNADFVLSAVKAPNRANQDEAVAFDLVIRGFSLAAEPTIVNLQCEKPPAAAFLLNLAEEAQSALPVDKGNISFTAAPYGIVSIGVKF